MKRNSLFFKFCTFFENENYRSRTNIDACTLSFMFLRSVVWSILFGMFGVLMFWAIGSIIGETIAMIVTQTFEKSFAKSFYVFLFFGTICVCISAILAFLVVSADKLIRNRNKSNFCKIIEIKD